MDRLWKPAPGDSILGSQLFQKHLVVFLKFHDDGRALQPGVPGHTGLSTYLSEHFRVQMGQVTVLTGPDAFDTEVTWSGIEPCPDCAPQGGRDVRGGSFLDLSAEFTTLSPSFKASFHLTGQYCTLRKSNSSFFFLIGLEISLGLLLNFYLGERKNPNPG